MIQLLGQEGASPGEAPEGGISIVQRGGVPKLIAQGKILDSVTGFSTTLHFPSPELERASALHAVGIPIGTPSKDSPFAGMGYFTPHAILRNLTAMPQTVTLTVEYPTASGWDATDDRIPHPATGTKSAKASPPPSAPDPSTLTAQTALAPLTLPGYSTQDVSLDSILGELAQPIPYASIRIQYSGAPGSVVAEVSSVEHSKDMVVDARIQNEGNGWAGSGANPWHLDNETESVVFLTNMGERTVPVGFKVWANGAVYYLTDLRLSPHETRLIDLRKLRDAQKPDPKGSKIPAGTTDGSVLWIRGDNVPVMGRLAVIKRHGGAASSYDCSPCDCPYSYEGGSLYTDPLSATVAIDSDYQYQALGDNLDCNANAYFTSFTYSSTWSSGNSSVATVSDGDVTGTGGNSSNGGTTTITASYDGCTQWSDHSEARGREKPLISCICLSREDDQSASTILVQYPASLSIVTDTSHTTPEATCSAGSSGTGCGVTRSFTYQVLDQKSNSITGSWIASQQVWDAINTTSPNGLGLTGYATTCTGKMGPPVDGKDPGTNNGPCGLYVNSLGQFHEGGLSVCSTYCYSKGTCVTAGNTGANQTCHIGSYSIVQQIKYYCDHVTVNGD